MGKSRTKKTSLSLWLGFAIVIGVLFCGYLLFGKPLGSLEASPSSNEKVLYEIPKNTSLSSLAQDLHAKGLIAFPEVFKVFFKLTGREKHIRAGFYYLPPRNSVVGMGAELRSENMATHTVTIPEGKASWEIYGIFKRYFSLDSVAFDSLVHDSSFALSLGIKAPGVEGYLFPDTYILPWRITEQDVLRCMVNRFQEVTAMLPPDSEVLKQYGTHGWVTLASIVEKEAAVSSEKRLIAGVFYNRLQQGWSLGADPTTRFALRKLTGPLSEADLDVNSPYNTRLYSGLPPGPVCNPGREALMAALQPQKTKMMFFVAKDDGSREHYFSSSNLEHNAFKALAAANRQRRQEELDSLSRNTSAPSDKTLSDTQNTGSVIHPTNTRISAAP